MLNWIDVRGRYASAIACAEHPNSPDPRHSLLALPAWQYIVRFLDATEYEGCKYYEVVEFKESTRVREVKVASVEEGKEIAEAWARKE